MILDARNFTDYSIRNLTELVMFSNISFDAPLMQQPKAVEVVRPNLATVDNWLRYEHINTVRDDTGRRTFSFADLLKIDCMEMLTAIFKIPPAMAALFANQAVEQYRPVFEEDLAEIAAGVPAGRISRDYDAHFSFVRDGEAVVKISEDEGDREDSVMLVLPTRVIARRLLGVIAAAYPGDEENGKAG